MSKIDDLIAKLCPDGVPLKKLADLEDQGLVKLGRGDVISKTDLSDTPGEFPVYSSSAAADGLFGRYGKFMFNDERITWSIDGGGKFFYRGKHMFSVTNVCGWLKVLKTDSISTRYLYHVLINIWGGRTYNYTIKAHPSVIREDYFVPLPPLDIQTEIVAILDMFTDLEAELEAELVGRIKQYEFYRESLFRNESNTVELKAIADIATIWRGRRFVKDDILQEGVPAVHYGEIYTKYGLEATEAFSFLNPELAARLRYAKSGDVILVSAGETIEDIGKSFTWFGKEDIVIHDACYGLRSTTVDPKYMVHFFNTHNFRSQLRMFISSSKISAISTEKLGKVIIPVPTLERQKEIANLLDSFDDVVTNVSYGLPAEIKARRQQYEYYRNKLLIFKELDVA